MKICSYSYYNKQLFNFCFKFWCHRIDWINNFLDETISLTTRRSFWFTITSLKNMLIFFSLNTLFKNNFYWSQVQLMSNCGRIFYIFFITLASFRKKMCHCFDFRESETNYQWTSWELYWQVRDSSNTCRRHVPVSIFSSFSFLFCLHRFRLSKYSCFFFYSHL